jgi:WD40 repeat protein
MEGISRDASGLCFDFPINDGTQYFTGTEEGLIHKCSVSYNEQTLEEYFGHSGPVYKVRCSPFLPDAFLSCSAGKHLQTIPSSLPLVGSFVGYMTHFHVLCVVIDWSCALWSQKRTAPILTFKASSDAYVDIDWSPANSCVFACASRDGRIEIWDLNYSPLDPIITHRIMRSDGDRKVAKELTCN